MRISRSQGQSRVPVSHPSGPPSLTGSRTGDDPRFRVLQCPFSAPGTPKGGKSDENFPPSEAASGSGLTSIRTPAPYRFPSRYLFFTVGIPTTSLPILINPNVKVSPILCVMKQTEKVPPYPLSLSFPIHAKDFFFPFQHTKVFFPFRHSERLFSFPIPLKGFLLSTPLKGFFSFSFLSFFFFFRISIGKSSTKHLTNKIPLTLYNCPHTFGYAMCAKA